MFALLPLPPLPLSISNKILGTEQARLRKQLDLRRRRHRRPGGPRQRFERIRPPGRQSGHCALALQAQPAFLLRHAALDGGWPQAAKTEGKSHELVGSGQKRDRQPSALLLRPAAGRSHRDRRRIQPRRPDGRRNGLPGRGAPGRRGPSRRHATPRRSPRRSSSSGPSPRTSTSSPPAWTTSPCPSTRPPSGPSPRPPPRQSSRRMGPSDELSLGARRRDRGRRGARFRQRCGRRLLGRRRAAIRAVLVLYQLDPATGFLGQLPVGSVAPEAIIERRRNAPPPPLRPHTAAILRPRERERGQRQPRKIALSPTRSQLLRPARASLPGNSH